MKFFVVCKDIRIGGGYKIDIFDEKNEAEIFIERQINTGDSELSENSFYVIEGREIRINATKVAVKVLLDGYR